jgi:hypothetical protein
MTVIREFEVTAEMKELGFSRIYRKDKNLVIYNSGTLLHAKYFPGDLDSTLHHLEKALTEYDKRNNNHFGNEKIERFIRWFAETDIKTAEAEDEAVKQIKIQENIDRNKIIEQIKDLKAANAGISSEDWRIGLVRRFETLRKVVDKNIPELWPGLEFELSAMRILNIYGCTLPFIGIILGRPAGGKTHVISLLRKWLHAYYTDIFTARSLVTHTTAVSEERELMKIDMLPRIKNKIFGTPEFSVIFTAKEDDLRALLGMITRIADGQGLASDSGAHGHRAYEGTHMLVWIGAAVDVPHNVYKVLSSLGPKLYFFRLPYEDRTIDDIVKEMGGDFSIKFESIHTALFDYLKWFEIGPDLKYDDSDGEGQQDQDPLIKEKDLRFKGDGMDQFKFHDDDDIIHNEKMQRRKLESERKEITGPRLLKMVWDRERDDLKAKKCIAQLAKLLSYLRCEVKTWHTEGTQGSEYGYSPSLPEDPKRAADILINLARAYALLFGRNYITLEDVPITIKTTLSTAQIERVSLFDLLLSYNGILNTTQMEEYLNFSPSTIRRIMTEFKATRLVKVEPVGSSHQQSMSLKEEFKWFLTDEFKKLREGFIPTDYHEFMKQPKKEKTLPPSDIADYSSAYDRIDIFWQKFNQLTNIDKPFTMQSDKRTVGRYELQEALVSSGKFHQNDALVIIDYMTNLHKIIKVAVDTYTKNVEENELLT